MARGVQHDESTKAAVMAALLTGQSASVVASEYRIPLGTVKAWAVEVRRENGVDAVSDRRERIGALLVDYIEAALVALRAQAEQFSDKTWLARQPASEVAVLHGVIADKTIRILEALAVDESADISGVHPPGES